MYRIAHWANTEPSPAYTNAAKALTSAFGARTAVFVVPSTFHTPWPRIVGAPLLALVCVHRRRK